MKRFSQPNKILPFFNVLRVLHRRQGWLLENLTCRKLWNLFVAAVQYALKQEVMRAYPVIVKVDISPLCNLRCTACVHANADGATNDVLRAQSFNAGQKMPLARFNRIVSEVAGKSMAVSLYYLGDPLVHPDLDAMCGSARTAGLNTHVSTNFSFDLSDERLHRIVTSGLTHLTVCVDGLSQESYGRTRVGGRIAVVCDNLERLMQIRHKLGRTHPKVEVQFIKFQHNVAELEQALNYFRRLGVEQVTDFWGNLHNDTDLSPHTYRVIKPKENAALPQCFWPHFALQIKYNGDVIPCCTYRHGLQYSNSPDARTVGNVFDTGLWHVWNSPAYRALRRFVSNPSRVERQPGLAETFCAGCPSIYETEFDKQRRPGDKYQWETLYQLDARSRISKKPRPAGQAAPPTVSSELSAHQA